MTRTRARVLPPPLQFLVLLLAGWINRAQHEAIEYLRAENAVFREVLGKRPRLTDGQRRRLATKAKLLGRARLAEIAAIATPDTILRWYRELVAKKYSAPRRPRGRRTDESIVDALLRFARECPEKGYTRLRDALWNVGHEVSRSTVVRILKEHGIEPAPERGRHSSWKTFLAAHWEVLAAADFFTVEVVTWTGLVRYHVFFFLELCTRRVHVAGIAHDPGGEWIKQIARNLVDPFEGFLRGKRYLILDRDPLYTKAFREILASAGVKVVRLPSRSPNLNPFCERWVRSIREECLSRLVPLGERFLRIAVQRYLIHYHRERNHQGLESRLIDPEPGVGSREGMIVRRMRLGGLLNYYHRVAA
jgi:hypothetical protein